MQFYYFEWYNVCNELCVYFILIWVIINEVIFNYLLMEWFVGNGVWVVNIQLVSNFLYGFWCCCWNDVVNYGVWEGDIFFNLCCQLWVMCLSQFQYCDFCYMIVFMYVIVGYYCKCF